MSFTNLEKTDMVLIYGEARGHSELAPRIYRERFPQRILPNSRTFVNVVQHLRDFGHFEINKRGLGRQPEDSLVVPDEEILHEIYLDETSSCKTKRLRTTIISCFQLN
jgi:hypothetical protein